MCYRSFSLDLVPVILCHNGLSCEETAKSGFIGFFSASFTTDSHLIILAFLLLFSVILCTVRSKVGT